MRLFAVLAALAILPAAAGAQNTYRRTPGDSLRYRETMKVVNTANTPAGELTTELDGEGASTFRFRRGDTATVTLHELKMTMKSPMGIMAPSAGSLQGQSFELLMSPRGHLQMLTTPDLPDEVMAMTNMSTQFVDYFLRLPEKTLQTGLEWTDTTTHTDSASTMRTKTTRVARYKVEKDTTVDGRKGWLITGAGEGEIQNSGSMSQGGMNTRFEIVMTTKDTDRVVLTADGFMVSRQLRTEQSGTSRINTPMMPVELAMSGVMELTRRLER